MNIGQRERRLTGVRLIIGGKNLGILVIISEFFSDTKYPRCTVHFYRNYTLKQDESYPFSGKQESSLRKGDSGRRKSENHETRERRKEGGGRH